MSTNKFLTVVSGVTRLVQAIASSAGVGDANKVIATGSDGKIDVTLLPTGVGPNVALIQASENLAAGDFINIHNVSGARVRKADASNGRAAHGFVLASVTSGQNATVYRSGANSSLTSLVPGTSYFLSSSSAGTATATATTTSGQIVQQLGVAESATSLIFEYNDPVVLDA